MCSNRFGVLRDDTLEPGPYSLNERYVSVYRTHIANNELNVRQIRLHNTTTVYLSLPGASSTLAVSSMPIKSDRVEMISLNDGRFSGCFSQHLQCGVYEPTFVILHGNIVSVRAITIPKQIITQTQAPTHFSIIRLNWKGQSRAALNVGRKSFSQIFCKKTRGSSN